MLLLLFWLVILYTILEQKTQAIFTNYKILNYDQHNDKLNKKEEQKKFNSFKIIFKHFIIN